MAKVRGKVEIGAVGSKVIGESVLVDKWAQHLMYGFQVKGALNLDEVTGGSILAKLEAARVSLELADAEFVVWLGERKG